jgi:dienelactone hydrolase
MTAPLLFPDDQQFWFETLRVLGQADFGGAEVGEALAAAAQIKPGDYDSWHDAWYASAERLRAEADAAAAAGHQITARDSYLRASTYYRSAEFFLHGNPDDPRIDRSYFASVDCFHAYAERSRPAVSIEPVQIPYEHTVLYGYLYRSAEAGPRPTMVMHSGYDGAAEEMHFNGALSGVERGYTVLTFDGPGQPAARHRDGLLFRPDWEHVVGPVLDWLLDRPEVDAARTGLLGVSLGGLLAPRAAAFEPRLAACVAVDGVYRFGAAAEQNSPADQAEPPSPTVRWAIDQARYVMGVRSPEDFVQLSQEYSLADGIAEQIACPTLVCEAEDDMFFEGQPQELYDHLTCPKELMRFTTAEGAGAHCHTGAQRMAFDRIYDWLDEILTTR